MKTKKQNPFFIIPIIVSVAVTGVVIFFLNLNEEAKKGKIILLPSVSQKTIGGSIAFDGEYFWATRIPLTSSDEGKKEIVKFDTTGKEIFSVIPEENFNDLAFDGKNIWTADVFGSEYGSEFDSKYYIVDKKTGEFYDQFSINENYTIDAMTATNRRLWVYVKIVTADLGRERYFYEIDAGSGGIYNKIPIPDDVPSTCSGIAFSSDFLWMAVGLTNHKLLQISSITGQIVNEYDYTGRIINGITTINGEIYLVDGEKNELFLHKK